MSRMLFVMVVGIASMVGAVPEAKADPVGGLVVKQDTVLPRNIDSWEFPLRAHETTRIRIAGDGELGGNGLSRSSRRIASSEPYASIDNYERRWKQRPVDRHGIHAGVARAS